MKSLEEAIKHYEKMAETEERKARLHQRPDKEIKGSGKRYLSCIECASEHRQLAEWLRELKRYRIAHWKLRDMDYEYDFNSMFGENPMYYGEKVWDLFGDIDASVEYEVMGYEEVNADGKTEDT